MKTSFQAGVDSIYNAIVAQGVTPANKTPGTLVTSIGTVATNKYNAGNSAGYSSGYNQGVSDTGQKYFWCDVNISGSGDFGAGNSVSATVTIQGTTVASVSASGNGGNKEVSVTLAAVEYYLIPVNPSDASYTNKVTITLFVHTGKDQGNGSVDGYVNINGTRVVTGSGKGSYSAHQTKIFKLTNNTLVPI